MTLVTPLLLSMLFVLPLPPGALIQAGSLPEKAKALLESATTVELFSLDPIATEKNPPKESGFHGWIVLGKTTLKGDTKKQALDAAKASIAKKADGARCFWPRHGIHVAKDNEAVDLVICYECSWVYVYYPDKANPIAVLTTASDAQATLDNILREAKVPLPPPPKK